VHPNFGWGAFSFQKRYATRMKLTAKTAERAVRKYADHERAKNLARFFKTKKGEYGEGDIFIGVTVPQVWKVAHAYEGLELGEVKKLLHSKTHEIRFLALIMLVERYTTGDRHDRDAIVRCYCAYTSRINNWDLVDVSAGRILGAWCTEHGWTVLRRFAVSKNMWERRIAMIATSAYIKSKDSVPTKTIATILLHDTHDLIHKAVGWMLREMGKNISTDELRAFLGSHAHEMPRTMLRYAIEKLPKQERVYWLTRTSRARERSHRPKDGV